MIRHYFAPSFERTYKKLSRRDQELVDDAVEALLSYLGERKNLPKGVGLKKLTKRYWEIRSSIDLRIIFELDNPLGFLLVGTHDDIKRFIRE